MGDRGKGADSGGTLPTIVPRLFTLGRVKFSPKAIGIGYTLLTGISRTLSRVMRSLNPSSTKSEGSPPVPIAVARYRLNVGNALE